MPMATPFLPCTPMTSYNGKSPGPESQTASEGRTDSPGHLAVLVAWEPTKVFITLITG